MQLLQTDLGIARWRGGHVLPADGANTVDLLEVELATIQEYLQTGRFAELGETQLVRKSVALQDLALQPLCQPTVFVIAGLNYRAHCEEIGRPVPDRLLFGTAPGSAAHVHQQPVNIPVAAPEEVDYEGEIGIVISQSASAVTAADAWQVVAGLVALNDVSARDVQAGGTLEALGQAKGFAGFKPFGPVLATLDEFIDPLDIAITTRVNGDIRQQGHSSDMVFNIPQIIEIVTRRQTLQPGDIICTGTPGGVAHGGQYPYLRSGDVVQIQLDNLPVLENRFV
ncbi:MAG: fumarylacetoacetate hydrolase family protein [Pseudomonadota bacterium]